jgi:hypothetical protein
VIAELPVVWVYPRGGRVPGRVAIGGPEPRGQSMACTVAMEGLHPARAISGGSALQALMFAVHYMEAMVRNFIEGGGRVLNEDEEDIGVLLVDPTSFDPSAPPPR